MFKFIKNIFLKPLFPILKEGENLSPEKIEKLNNWLKQKKIFYFGGGWGDRIQWRSWEEKKLYGWKTPKPKKGDILIAEGVDGKNRLYGFLKVEDFDDPHDYFEAEMVFTGIEII